MNEEALSHIERLCAPLESALVDSATQEIHCLAGGAVWWIGGGRRRLEPVLSSETRELVARFTAAYFGRTINEERPDLSAAPLPLSNAPWRVTVSMQPVSPEAEITLRRLRSNPIPLIDYVESGRITQSASDLLLERLHAREGILVAGPQRSGKTTFMRALLRAYLASHPDQVLTIVEDTIETVLPSQFCVHYLYSCPTRTLGQLVTFALRKGSDLILLGEARDHEAVRTLLTALLSGHGGVTTFHAGSPSEALYRLCDLAGSSATPGTVASALPVFVQIAETSVTEITALHHKPTTGEVSFDPVYRQGDSP